MFQHVLVVVGDSEKSWKSEKRKGIMGPVGWSTEAADHLRFSPPPPPNPPPTSSWRKRISEAFLCGPFVAKHVLAQSTLIHRDGKGGKLKGLKVCVRGPSATPSGVQGQCLRWGSEGKSLWSWWLFLSLRYEKPHFLALYPVSNTHSQNLFTVLSGFLPEEQTRLRQRSLSKDSILLT